MKNIDKTAGIERSVLIQKAAKDGFKPQDKYLRQGTAVFTIFDKSQDGVISDTELKKISPEKYKEAIQKTGAAFGVPWDERKDFFPEYGYLLDKINKNGGSLDEKAVEEVLEACDKSKKPPVQ